MNICDSGWKREFFSYLTDRSNQEKASQAGRDLWAAIIHGTLLTRKSITAASECQQGRVQLDADWNEQMDIQSYIDRTTTGDTIGLCGAPIQHGGSV